MYESVTVLTDDLPWFARALADDPAIRIVTRIGTADVVVTPGEDRRVVLEPGAAGSGARGVVTISTSSAELRMAVRAVACGARYIASDLVEPPVANLAPREVETLSWLARGLTHRQIAHRMCITETTVDTYVKRLRGKLNAGNKAQLTSTAIDLGYLATTP